MAPADFHSQLTRVGCSTVIIDCRPAFQFDAGHVRGAVNAPCDRVSAGKTLKELISLGKDDRGGFGRYSLLRDVIIYDSDSTEALSSRGDTPARIMAGVCMAEPGITACNIVQGGYAAFSSRYPFFCVSGDQLARGRGGKIASIPIRHAVH